MGHLRFFLIIMFLLTVCTAGAQNALINILTQNGGVVKKGESVFIEVSVCNTDATDSFPVYKLRPQISVPKSLVIITEKGHELPAGWTIVSNDGSTIRLSNGEDKIPPTGCRTLLIAIRGIATGGPSTVSGNLSFSNGISPGAAPGSPTKGDLTADNASTTTCVVKK